MKKNVVLAMIAIMGISLSACGNKVEEAANTETVETVSNEEIVKETPTPATVSDSTVTTSEETIEIPETDVPKTEETSEIKASSKPVEVPSEPSSVQTNTNSTSDYSSDISAADTETLYQENRHKWTTGTTWKASNGVELKINDAWADAVKAGNLGSDSAIWFEDPDIDPTPNSPYMNALNEFMYGTDEAFLNGKDRWNSEVVDVSKLPDIPLASSKQTSVIETDASRAYKEAYDTMYGFQVSGEWKANPAFGLQFGFDGGKGIGLVASARAYLWTIEYNGSEWVVTINHNLSELQWDGLHNSLRLISPDGDILFNEFFKQCYEDNPTFPEYDMWVTIGNSQAMASGTDGAAIFYFK